MAIAVAEHHLAELRLVDRGLHGQTIGRQAVGACLGLRVCRGGLEQVEHPLFARTQALQLRTEHRQAHRAVFTGGHRIGLHAHAAGAVVGHEARAAGHIARTERLSEGDGHAGLFALRGRLHLHAGQGLGRTDKAAGGIGQDHGTVKLLRAFAAGGRGRSRVAATAGRQAHGQSPTHAQGHEPARCLVPADVCIHCASHRLSPALMCECVWLRC